MSMVGVVHPVGEVSHPTRIRFDADDLEIRVSLEDATETQHAHDVLIAVNQLHERVDLGAAGLIARLEVIGFAGRDVKTHRQTEVDAGLP
jgi:hypothetical protein